MQISLLYIISNDLLCYLHILVFLNIHESKSAQVGHLHRYAAFYTILNASAPHVTSPLVTLVKGQLFGGYLCACYCLSLRQEKSS